MGRSTTRYLLKKAKKAGKFAYSGAAALGKANASMSLVVFGLLGLILIGVGIYLLFKAPDEAFQGTVTAYSGDLTSCYSLGGKSLRTQLVGCATVSFAEKGQQSPGQVITVPVTRPYEVGQSITIYKDGNDGNSFNTSPNNSKIGGILLIVFGVFIIAMALVQKHMTETYKPYAAYQGAGLIGNALFGNR
jgi:hypothetical protein